ncbi:killer cell lectin-like receptor subfamily G member 2 [Pleurodeles waltl]|uniref:killer cell lectin-like receptor subfamily G member 2 n=1 Tax=Pleurodeles waltl TaxID=8319 RepID=UPI003709B60B
MEGPGSQRKKGPECQRMEGPECQGLEGPECQGMEGPGSQRKKGPECQRMEGPECQRMEGPECQGLEGPECQGMEGPECHRMEGPGCQRKKGPECQRMEGTECQRIEGPECQRKMRDLLFPVGDVDLETGLRLPPSPSSGGLCGSRSPSTDSGYSDAGSRPPSTDYLSSDTPLSLPETRGQHSPGPRPGAVDGAGSEWQRGEEVLLGPGGRVTHGAGFEDPGWGLHADSGSERTDLELGQGGTSVQLRNQERVGPEAREEKQKGASAPDSEQQSPLLTPGPEASRGASPGSKRCMRTLLPPTDTSSSRVLLVLCALCALLLLLVVTLAALTGHCFSQDAPVPSRSEPCPMDWLYSGNKCYYFSMMYKKDGAWSNSQSLCSSYNGSLAFFDTQEELNFLTAVSCDHHMWVGLRKREDGIHWVNGTTCSSSLCTITDFGDCAYIGGGSLRVSGCHLPRPYICTKRPYV